MTLIVNKALYYGFVLLLNVGNRTEEQKATPQHNDP